MVYMLDNTLEILQNRKRREIAVSNLWRPVTPEAVGSSPIDPANRQKGVDQPWSTPFCIVNGNS